MLRLHLFRKLLSDDILIVEAINALSLVLGASLWVSRAYDFTGQIDLRFEAVLSFFTVLIPQLFPLLRLSSDEFILTGLEVFEIALVHIVVVGEELAYLVYVRMECVRI